MGRKERFAVLGAVLGVVAGLCSGWAMLGQPTKLPGAITLYFTGFGSGASLAVIAFRHRLERQGPSPGPLAGGQPTTADDSGHPVTR